VTAAVALARAAGRGDAAPIADQVRQLWISAATAGPPPLAERLGRPVGECDPLVLEVQLKERRWLPVLSSCLPLPIPTPVRSGTPSERSPRCGRS
jgi:hypothetical protein